MPIRSNDNDSVPKKVWTLAIIEHLGKSLLDPVKDILMASVHAIKGLYKHRQTMSEYWYLNFFFMV